MKHISTKIIILKRIDFGEADRILTVITPDIGKVSLLARGVRKSKSKLAGSLELFSVANIVFIDGKSELKTLISAQLDKYYGNIIANINSTMMGYDFLKKTDTFTQHSCDPEYFELINNGLEALHLHDKNPELVYVWFLNSLLVLSGSAINTEKQSDGSEYSENDEYSFSYEHMAFSAHRSGNFGPKHIKFLRLLSKVTTPENLIRIADADKIAIELKPILENCCKLAHH